MFKKLPFMSALCAACLLFVLGCASQQEGLDLLDDTTSSAVIVTRTDDWNGNIDVYLDGRKRTALAPGGKWGQRIKGGRHTLSITYQNKRSKVIDFMINNDRVNFKATAFKNDQPSLAPF